MEFSYQYNTLQDFGCFAAFHRAKTSEIRRAWEQNRNFGKGGV